jgi:hypothetical protein
MPAKLSNLRNNSKVVRITFSKDEYIDVTIFPHRLTQDVIDRFGDASRDKDYDLAAETFREVVAEWDLMGDDDEPMPIDGDTFRYVGTMIFNQIWDEINDVVTPKSRKQNRR